MDVSFRGGSFADAPICCFFFLSTINLLVQDLYSMSPEGLLYLKDIDGGRPQLWKSRFHLLFMHSSTVIHTKVVSSKFGYIGEG